MFLDETYKSGQETYADSFERGRYMFIDDIRELSRYMLTDVVLRLVAEYHESRREGYPNRIRGLAVALINQAQFDWVWMTRRNEKACDLRPTLVLAATAL